MTRRCAGLHALAAMSSHRPLALAGLSLSWSLALAGCPREQAPAPVAPSFVASDPRIRFVGRVDRRGDSVRIAWPATSFVLRVTGTTHVALDVRDVPRPDTTPESDELAVSVDGGAWRRLKLRPGRGRYVAADGLSRGAHTIVVAKRTEAEVGTVEVLGVSLAPGGRLLPAPHAPGRRLEALGDSVTAGFGNEGRSGDCPWSAEVEDATRTYAALAARTLGADYTALAFSGKGLTRNADARDPEPYPPLFERVLPEEPARWSFARAPPPDAVIVNLGTNDFVARPPPDAARLRASYEALLRRVRAVYPRAHLVAVVGPMLWDDEHQRSRSALRAAITGAVEALVGGGDARIEVLEQWANPAEGVGCQFHPNLVGHRRLGEELAQLLRARLGW